jgi:hypothetical protein
MEPVRARGEHAPRHDQTSLPQSAAVFGIDFGALCAGDLPARAVEMSRIASR